jgi:hypothetical protein
MFFFWGGGGGIGTVFSRGRTGVCFSLMEGGTGVCLFLWGDQYTIFFSTADFFFFILDLGGDHGPSRSPHRSISAYKEDTEHRFQGRKM